MPASAAAGSTARIPVLDIGIILTVFALVFVAELPDKTAIASLVLGTRFPWIWVFAGTGAAFVVHVLVALAAGQLLHLLPAQLLEAVIAVLFLLGAFLIWREGQEDDEGEEDDAEEAATSVADGAGFWKVASVGFGVIFVAEWGDLTQIMTANLAAKYHDPLSVGIGAVLGLWAVSLIALLGGRTLLKFLPIKWITRAAAVVMVVLGILSAVNAIRG
nr:TMEM165/GDT1 family protein [Flexivirga aerilata]